MFEVIFHHCLYLIMIRRLINPTKNIFKANTLQLLIGAPINQSNINTNQQKQSLISSKPQNINTQLNLHRKISQSQITTQKVSQHEQLGGKGTRIQIAIFKIQLSQFINKHFNQIQIFKQIQQYNPALTHGGLQLEQFPLIKLIHIALYLLSQNKVEVSVWKKLQFFIRKRMHRCTVEQNMRVLLIMLKSFPYYRFDYDFILNTCLALKKELQIMNNQELQTLYFVLSTNKNSSIRYQNTILIDLQTLILTKVIKKAETKMEQTNKGEKSHLPIEYLVQWINIGLPLSLRNQYEPLSLEIKVLRLMNEFNTRWECIVKNNQGVKSLPEETVYIIMDLLSMYHKIVKYQSKNQSRIYTRDRKYKTEQVNYCIEFKNTEWSIFIHSRKTITRLIKLQPTQSTLHLFCCLIQIYNFQQIDNILDVDQINQQFKQNSELTSKREYQQLKFHANRLLRVEDSSQSVVRDKLKIISKFLDFGVYSPQIAKTYYQSLQLPPSGTLETIQCLIKIQLLLFSHETNFSPRLETVNIVMNFLENYNQTYRHFDWYSFHFINLIAKHTKIDEISTNLPVHHTNHEQNKDFIRTHLLSKKILQQIKLSNTSELVEEEIQVLSLKKEVRELEKFFLEIRVHAMEKGKVVISPFHRLPHFANVKDKVAVNAYTTHQLNHKSVVLQKKLLNLMGWKVVNIDTSQFMQLMLNDRLKIMSSSMERQERIIEENKAIYLDNELFLPQQN